MSEDRRIWPTGFDERKALYEQFLRCIDREENLVHFRLTWGIQWNAAILAAIFAMSSLPLGPSLEFSIRIILSGLGALSGWLSYTGVSAAFEQSRYLIDEVERRLKIPKYENPEDHHKKERDWESSEFMRPFGQQGTVHLPARKAAIKFPLLFIGIWLSFLIYTSMQLLNHVGWVVVPIMN